MQPIKIFHHSSQLPSHWNQCIGKHNILLSQEYFLALDQSKPQNMQCCYIGFFDDKDLIGGAIAQRISFEKHNSFQKDAMICSLKNNIVHYFSASVLILGNNMLSGQNGFYFNPEKISEKQSLLLLKKAIDLVDKTLQKSDLIIIKDINPKLIENYNTKAYKKYYQFQVQPNMTLTLHHNWKTYQDYLQDFTSKYRMRANTARKKSANVVYKELNEEEIFACREILNQLYHNVAEKAIFNTFFLDKNHFFALKQHLKDNFKLFVCTINDEIVGFYSLLVNNKQIETYFLGYNTMLQKEKQLYLNMLLNMIEFSIETQAEKIVFGRTALEIKSTVGAIPESVLGYIKHNNKIINVFMPKLFTSLEPKTSWTQRKPFK